MKIVLIVLLLCGNYLCVEMKAIRDSAGVTRAKVMIKNPMLTKDVATKMGIKQEFLTRIVAKEDDKIMFDLISSEYLSKNPSVMFAYRSIGASALSIEATDNNGNNDNLTQTIVEKPNLILLSEIKSTGKEGKIYHVNIPAIKKVFGDIEFIDTDRIQLLAPDVVANAGAVQVDVYSDIKAKSVALFAKQEDKQMKFICQWQISEHSIIDYTVKIKLYYTEMDQTDGNLKIIIEGEDGKFYTTEKKVRVPHPPTCDGS